MAHLGPHLYREDSSDIVEPASDVFEIDDFTSPSDWEKFVSRVEHLIREWGLNREESSTKSTALQSQPKQAGYSDGEELSSNDLSNWRWKEDSTVLTFYDFEFLVTRFYRENTTVVSHSSSSEETYSETSKRLPRDNHGPCRITPSSWRGETPEVFRDLLSPVIDFPPKHHPIHDYYGINHFVLLSPNAPNEKEDIDNETRAKIALSTVTVAVHNTHCQVPFFVQVMDRYKNMYNGIFAGGGFRTNFEMIVLSKRPPHSNHLTGLLTMFKKKLCQPIPVEVPSVRVTVRCSYNLDDWTSHAWSQPPPDLDMFTLFGGHLGFVNDLSNLPFGSTKDPVRRLHLHTTWCDLQEDIITDNDVHTDLDPLEAPQWSVGVLFETRPHCLLAEYLDDFSNLVNQNETLKELLGDLIKEDLQGQHLEKLPNVFNRLTGPTYTLTDIIQSGKSPRKTTGGPIKDEYLTKILEYIFPDSLLSPEHPYPKDFASYPKSKQNNQNREYFRVAMGGIKSSPIDGLVWRLGIALGHCLHVLGKLSMYSMIYKSDTKCQLKFYFLFV